MPTLTPGIVAGRPIRWLLDLEWAGRTWRLSDVDVVVTTAGGDDLVYDGTLTGVETDEESSDPGGTQSPLSVSLDVVLSGADIAALVASGFDLTTARGTLARWVEGTTYEERRVLLIGTVADPEYGATTEPIGLTLEAAPWDDVGSIPDPDLAVIGANWSTDMILSLLAEDVGLPYPMVLGAPGAVSTAVASSGWVTGSEAVWIDRGSLAFAITGPTLTGDSANLSLLVAGHHVNAASVELNNDDYTEGHRFLVTNAHDFRGHPIAVCRWYATAPAADDEWTWDGTPAGVGTYTFTDGGIDSIGRNAINHDPSFHPPTDTPRRIFVGWAHGGGAVPDGGAGDILVYLLERSRVGNGVGVDYSAWATVAPYLNRFRLACSITATTKPWDYITAHLLPILPVSIDVGPDGIYPVIWHYGATADMVTARLNTTIDPRIERVGRIRYDRSKVVNDITISYAYSVRTQAYCAKQRIVGNVADIQADTDEETPGELHPLCRLSQTRYRDAVGRPLVVAETIESAVIYDDATARLVLDNIARQRALSTRRMSFVAPEGDYGWIRRGAVLSLTDVDVSLDDTIGLVRGVTIDGSGDVRLSVLIQEDPVRDMVPV